MRIWVDENIPQGRDAFGAHGEVISFAGRALSRRDLAAADALLVRSVTRVDAALLEGTPVRFVGSATIGTDHVDLEYLRARGIGFSAAPGSNANSVAEYLAAALAWLQVKKQWPLAGKVMGLVGYGHVGRLAARAAEAVGMTVLKCDPPLRAAAAVGAPVGGREEFLDLEDLLARSDAISLHVPLTRDGPCPTYHLVNSDFFARLGRPITLINTCRGDVVREADLRAALEAGRVRHLVLDVFAGEPRIDPGLCAAADLITPHIAGYSLPGKLNGTAQVAAAFRAWFGLGRPWTPARPPPENPDIDYAPFATRAEADFLYHCLARAYDINADDARLRAALASADPAAGFDRMRRHYPVRHEFAAYRIVGFPPGKPHLRLCLEQLGFLMQSVE